MALLRACMPGAPRAGRVTAFGKQISRWLKGGRRPELSAEQLQAAAIQRALTYGDAARAAGDWTEAVRHYHAALDHDPERSEVRIQLGHALKESGRLAEAEAAYRIASQQRADDPEPATHLAHLLRGQGRRAEAVDAFLLAYGRAQGSRDIRDALISMGARDRLPGGAYGQGPMTVSLARLSDRLQDGLEELDELRKISSFPIEAHDAFRRTFPVTPPPGEGLSYIGALSVIVDARECEASHLRETLRGLKDQSTGMPPVCVWVSNELHDHPVSGFIATAGGMAATDVEETLDFLARSGPESQILLINGGTILDPTAIAWLRYAVERTSANAAYGDHDQYERHWRRGLVRTSPSFQNMPDPVDLSNRPDPPVTALVAPYNRDLVASALSAAPVGEILRTVLTEAARKGPVAHVPRLLAGVPYNPDPPTLSATPRQPKHNATSTRILLVIPTRDEARMLQDCVTAFRDQAERADLLDIVVVNNRSQAASTADVLAELVEQQHIEVLPAHDPFNWSSLNNRAAQKRDQEIFVFANNDVRVVTPGWDALVRSHLSEPGVGVVGARLTYPDNSIQHAGLILNAYEGRPMHEGVHAGGTEPGPSSRWLRSRPVAAITGAFLAVSREMFVALDGFNENLAVAYNDIDFCLRARAFGKQVRYAADLSLIHYESKTRGHNDSPARIAWDDLELGELHKIWGEAIFFDPGLNPHWQGGETNPFAALRDPPRTQILEWIDRSARDRPWTLAAATDAKPDREDAPDHRYPAHHG